MKTEEKTLKEHLNDLSHLTNDIKNIKPNNEYFLGYVDLLNDKINEIKELTRWIEI